MNLYKLKSSPFADSTVTSCLAMLTAEDAVLLTQDATYTLQDKQCLTLLSSKTNHIFVIQADRLARGLIALEAIKDVTYEEMVELCVTYDRVISW